MKIAIKFKDNDFHNTFFGVLKTLLNSYQHNDDLPTDKIILCDIINDLSPICYNLFQSKKITEISTEHNHYLQITPDNIFINEEVDEYAKLTDYHNHNTFVLDTDLYIYNNNPLYSL